MAGATKQRVNAESPLLSASLPTAEGVWGLEELESTGVFGCWRIFKGYSWGLGAGYWLEKNLQIKGLLRHDSGVPGHYS